jgi:TolB-like protein/DNA-binding winged helix-turn-helix (wHTH) protein
MEETGKTLKNPEKAPRRLYDFGPFRADPQKRVLLKDGQPVALAGKPFDILLALLESHGELLTKDQLSGRLWPDTVVEEGNLWRNVSSLRKALGESPDGHPYIVTQARQGYRFVGDVRECRQNVDPQGEGVQIVSKAPLIGARRRRRRGTLAAACAGLLSVAALLIQYGRARLSGPALHSLAVLPLVNLSGDPAQDYFADGITEELITALAQIERLQVTSRTSVMRYKNTRKPIDQIARELKVDAVLEGSAMRTGEHVRITAQLIRTSTDTHVWARSYDGELRDLLGFEREVATAIAREVAVKLAPKTAAVTRPLNPEAYELYLKGRYFWNRRDTQDLIKAAGYFARAVAKDPGYAPAYAGLADASDLQALDSPRTSGALGALAKARLAAAKAIELDDSLAEAHTSLAGAKVLADWDWSGAEREFQRALALDPRSAPAHHWYATLLLAPLGRTGKAAVEMRQALDLDPLSLIYNTDLGWIYFVGRQYSLAAAQYKQVLDMEPHFIPALFRLEQAYEALGMYPEALATQVESESILDTGLADLYRRSYASAGQKGLWQARLQIASGRQTPGDSEFDRARMYSALGRKGEAMKALSAGLARHAPALVFLKADPVFDPLRTERAFQDVERQIGLLP